MWITGGRQGASCEIDSEQIESPPGFARDVASATRIGVKLACALLMMLAIAGESTRAQQTAGPQGPEEEVIRQQTWLIPAQDGSTLMWTNVFRPPGDGPFPLAIINHGSTQNDLQRAAYRRPVFRVLSEWLVARGYAVAVPQRPGHGETGGTYNEDQGSCANADYRKAGRATASVIEAAMRYMLRQPFVRRDVVMIGQSAGGWGALALASENVRPIRAVVAFAPGRGGHVNGEANRNCAPDRLVAVAGDFGQTARIPTLWIYAENDSYFAPDLSKRLAAAFRLAGGRSEYHLLPPVGADGHDLISNRDAVALWAPLVEPFLKASR